MKQKDLEKLNQKRKKINCPRCSNLFIKKKMKLIKHPSRAILDVCESCGGIWLDGDEVKLLHDYSNKKVKKWQKKKQEE